MTVLVRARYTCDFCPLTNEIVECEVGEQRLPDGWTTVQERVGGESLSYLVIRHRCPVCTAAVGFRVRAEKPTLPRRTKSQVLAARNRGGPLAGCCERYYDNKACDCLETAEDDL